MKTKLIIGPNLYNWDPEIWRDFYFKIADEAPVDEVVLGEVICSKRAPLFNGFFDEVVERLENSGKKIIFSTLAEITSNIDRRLLAKQVSQKNIFIEANDVAALLNINNTPHAIGSYMNVYNEEALEFFAKNGATNITLSPEIPKSAIAELNKTAKNLNIDLEIIIYGRIGLALSARCYHARAHKLTKDSCKFICDEDPDGMDLTTLEGREFLTINGIQTMSYTCLNLANEINDLQKIGIYKFRISPQSKGTIHASKVFRNLLDNKIDKSEAMVLLEKEKINAPFSNGFFHGLPGNEWRV
ncbi:MAG: U32 family peptidase [Devosiaceae bacterium]|nr:U32 family peptidase [Devosiaceae bacterium]